LLRSLTIRLNIQRITVYGEKNTKKFKIGSVWVPSRLNIQRIIWGKKSKKFKIGSSMGKNFCSISSDMKI